MTANEAKRILRLCIQYNRVLEIYKTYRNEHGPRCSGAVELAHEVACYSAQLLDEDSLPGTYREAIHDFEQVAV